MSSIHLVAQLALAAGAIGVVALVVQPIAARLHLPAPAAFLGGGIVIGLAWPLSARALTPRTLAEIGTLLLIVILADGGLSGGWSPVRRQLGPVLALGVGGTAATFALVSLVAHALVGLSWPVALVVGAILAPTDPVAVFSLLSERRLRARRARVVLEAEAGVNDPVAIALTLPLIDAAEKGGSASALHVLAAMGREGVVGAAVGVAAALLLGRVLGERAPRIGVAPALTVLSGAFLVFGAATLAHGSGFLAAYVYGLVLGDRHDLPERRVVEGLHGQLSSLGEIAMFVMLGVALARVDLSNRWGDALVLAAALTVVVRPLVAYTSLRAFRFTRPEAIFACWGGLKGAVPILLAGLAYGSAMPLGGEVFGLTGLVVLVTLVAQGSTLGRAVSVLGLEAKGSAVSPARAGGAVSAALPPRRSTRT